MPAIVIVPAGPRDAAMHKAQFASLALALGEAGYRARLDDEPLEQRSGAIGFVTEVALHVGEVLSADMLLRLGSLVREHLRGLRRPVDGSKRQAVIYGPNGDVLSRVDLLDED